MNDLTDAEIGHVYRLEQARKLIEMAKAYEQRTKKGRKEAEKLVKDGETLCREATAARARFHAEKENKK